MLRSNQWSLVKFIGTEQHSTALTSPCPSTPNNFKYTCLQCWIFIRAMGWHLQRQAKGHLWAVQMQNSVSKERVGFHWTPLSGVFCVTESVIEGITSLEKPNRLVLEQGNYLDCHPLFTFQLADYPFVLLFPYLYLVSEKTRSFLQMIFISWLLQFINCNSACPLVKSLWNSSRCWLWRVS